MEKIRGLGNGIRTVRLEILRTQKHDFGVFGELWIDGEKFCSTCEQPWANNKPFHSCVPAGEYQVVPWKSDRFGDVVALFSPALSVYLHESDIPQNTSGRFACLIHNANWPSQVEGCIAVGEQIVPVEPYGLGVSCSKKTLWKLQQRWGNRLGLTAKITWAPGVLS